MTAPSLPEERVILVDPDNQAVGWLEKLRAHREGRLHRAFSVFVFDPAGALLLQRRAIEKYHSGGRWSNTCCGHPRPGEDTAAAAARRLEEEMGFRCPLHPAFAFRYRTRVGPELLEHEHDTVFVGGFEGTPRPDPAEVAEWRHVPLPRLGSEVRRAPNRYTVWLRLILRQRGDELLSAMRRLLPVQSTS
ncbi:MAG TPA: isopentenyl-diphosphate Delta-isomerase [Gemmatimonadales bacterium]|nr:isopentenyl-diphosphate Delta-isomerase [Gemmatimonadales bacterium]HNG79077.1 isopentenyl-diphosphate Delta-isomerase [Burkholderiaceae bacterium]